MKEFLEQEMKNITDEYSDNNKMIDNISYLKAKNVELM